MVHLTKTEAAEIILDVEHYWTDCGVCGGFGGVMKGSGVTDGIYKQCHSCRGQGRYMKREVKKAFKLLGLDKPRHPGPRRFTVDSETMNKWP